MQDYTIAETYELPSKGEIYKRPISPTVKLRSMTTTEEMRRLSHTETPYKTLCDIIDDCMVDPKLEMSSYDMHLGDYQFLLHKLRVVTYGSDYPSSSICPICGKQNKKILNLDEIEIFRPDDKFKDLFEFDLPRTQKRVRLKFQTPRDLDEIPKEIDKYQKQFPEADLNLNYLFTLKHVIDTIDGKKLGEAQLEIFLKKLPLMDSNLILQKATKITEKVGVNTIIENSCPSCGSKYRTTFRITNEFFGPTID